MRLRKVFPKAVALSQILWLVASQVVVIAGEGLVTPVTWTHEDSTTGTQAAPPDHRLIRRVNPNGNIAHWDYFYPTAARACRGRETYWEPDYYRTLLDYPSTNHTIVAERRDGTNLVTHYYYDPEIWAITNVIGPNSTNWEQSTLYDESQNPTNLTTLDHADSTYTTIHAQYDGNHNVTNWARGYGAVPSNAWKVTWDSDWNVPTSGTDPEGTKVEVDYTAGLVSRVGLVVSPTRRYDTTIGYTADGLLKAITNANGHWVRFDHNGAGHVTNVVPQVGPSVQIGRDLLGHVASAALPGASGKRTVSVVPDEMGRPLSITLPDGRSESYQRDAYGKVTSYLDAAGRTTTVAYTIGNLASVTSKLETPTGTVDVAIQVEYDQQLNTVRITEPLGRSVEAYVLDDADRIVVATNLEGQAMGITYALAGFVDTVTRFDGSEVEFDYSAVGQIARVRYASLTNSYTYLRNGLLRTAENEAGVLSNSYDSASRLTLAVGVAPSGTVRYVYDPFGNVTNMGTVAGNTDYAFDAAERLSDFDGPHASFSLTYNPYNGMLAANAYDNGITAAYTYDVVDRLTGVSYTNASGTVPFSASNLFNDADMITNIVWNSGEQVGYTYDSLDRLTGETRLDPTGGVRFAATYQYDLAGNRSNTVIDGGSQAYTLGQGNRLASWGTAGQMHHDAAGTVTQVVYSASSRVQFERNDRRQVTAAYTNGTLAETYGYDVLGRRVFVGQGAVTNYHVYDGIHVVADVAPDGSLVRSYSFGPGIDNILSMTDHTGASPITYHYLTDHLGSVHAIADGNGTIVERYQYDAWGRVLGVYDGNGTPLDESAIANHYLWQGRWFSWETGLYCFRARWYDPVTGRWLSKDPIGISGGLNQYVFCDNNPVNRRDPFGCGKLILVGTDDPLYGGAHKIRVVPGEFLVVVHGSRKVPGYVVIKKHGVREIISIRQLAYKITRAKGYDPEKPIRFASCDGAVVVPDKGSNHIRLAKHLADYSGQDATVIGATGSISVSSKTGNMTFPRGGEWAPPVTAPGRKRRQTPRD